VGIAKILFFIFLVIFINNFGRQLRCPAKAADLVNRRADRGQLGVDEPLPAVAQAGAHGFQSIALGAAFAGRRF